MSDKRQWTREGQKDRDEVVAKSMGRDQNLGSAVPTFITKESIGKRNEVDQKEEAKGEKCIKNRKDSCVMEEEQESVRNKKRRQELVRETKNKKVALNQKEKVCPTREGTTEQCGWDGETVVEPTTQLGRI